MTTPQLYLFNDHLWVYKSPKLDTNYGTIQDYFQPDLSFTAPIAWLTPIVVNLTNIQSLDDFKDHYPEYFI